MIVYFLEITFMFRPVADLEEAKGVMPLWPCWSTTKNCARDFRHLNNES